MLLAIESAVAVERFGEKKAFELIKQAGFDAVDFSLFEMDATKDTGIFADDYLEQAVQTKCLLDQNGLVCNQAHAPFSFRYGDEMNCTNQHYLDIVRSMEYASIIGAKHIVIHSIKVPAPFGADGFGSEQWLAYNHSFFDSLKPYSKEFGIKIALENQRYSVSVPYMMNDLLHRLNDPQFVVCVDVGHAVLGRVPPEDYISCITPGMIHGLHLHDNHGALDEHLLPGLGTLAWEKIFEALAKAKYVGDFTLEVPFFLEQFDPEVTPEALAFAGAVGHSYKRRYETIKKRISD